MLFGLSVFWPRLWAVNFQVSGVGSPLRLMQSSWTHKDAQMFCRVVGCILCLNEAEPRLRPLNFDC
jgi:hypothetical protein